MPKKGPDQIDFTDYIAQNPSDFDEGFVWFLSNIFKNGTIALMGHKGKGWTIWSFFRGMYSRNRQWVDMPTWKKIGELTGINAQICKDVALDLEKRGFLRFRRGETRSGKEKVIGFTVIDNLFYQALDGANRVEAISTVFEPELLGQTMKGLSALKKTGDHSLIPNTFVDKNPPINVHITINNNIVKQGDNSAAFIVDAKKGVEVDPVQAQALQEFLSTPHIKDAIGKTLGEAMKDWKTVKDTGKLEGNEPE